MYRIGEVVAGRYRIDGLCSDSGGMGQILFVTDTSGRSREPLVLKYCRQIGEEITARFRREVRILSEYRGNPKVAQLVDYDLDVEPPFFVMKYYEGGDLTRLHPNLNNNPTLQESVFLEMINCISELHARNQYHRDIKPQNFLISNNSIFVSDFGLSMEFESGTAFTRSSMYWGTPGYLPPEFLNSGGFKNADAASDIFMLGKSFYVLLTRRDPVYLMPDGIPAPIYYVIERACAIDKRQRYQSLPDLKQNLVIAYDVIIGRNGTISETQQLFSNIIQRLKLDNQYDSTQFTKFLEKLFILATHDKIRLCLEFEKEIFFVLRQPPLATSHLGRFLDVYKLMVESEGYGWGFSESIASYMKILFKGDGVPVDLKARALELAIDASHRMNRFAAMDICISMICEVSENNLGFAVAAVIHRNPHSFIVGIEPVNCKSDAVRTAVTSLKTQ
ncbi:serine/threonine-protein kinase [Sphaerotilus sp.]|uniref:serine/threonine protein kinase n=1 Tax=Sphaerotilus sp. TaxID=2093942 RepID=UPI002ACEA4E5|nr:serine/threonine-protein kinase [Sphaerotilus sp.]MDZ7856856.1 serine/threonine-protein kinase [Sphaerotilus sp.]